jgi:hypothetical protein
VGFLVWRIVRTGTWLYDESIPAPVWILEADYDFWYELAKADHQLEPGEEPALNEAGLCYYAAFKAPTPGDAFWPATQATMSLAEACAAAQAKVPSSISWND